MGRIKRIANGVIAGVSVALAAGLATAAAGEEIGRVGVDWVGNDIIIESIADPQVEGVTCHIAYFDRSLWDRVSQGNWFEDPSYSAVDCSRTGPITIGKINRTPKGEVVFSASRSLIFKSLRVTRIYDAGARTLVYLAHANELTQGSGKMSMSAVPLLPEDQAGN